MSATSEDPRALAREIEKLKKINASLISRLERPQEGRPSAFALFENAATVERQVRHQTEDLRQALRVLESSNDALHQAKQMAECANALKTTFLASVSHDLLQPLHAARLALSVVSDMTLQPPGTALLKQADRSLSTLEDIIKTLLDLSKLDAGVSKPEIRDVATTGLIDDLCAEFAPLAAARKLTLRKRGAALDALTDPLMLRRILQNFLSNAFRYTRRGGVLICCTKQAHCLRIDVADTGPGIQSNRRSAIFEEFQRDDPGIGDEPGFGLGLAIVRRLAVVMGHEIKLWSRPGFGSVFSILVPLAQKPVRGHPDHANPLPAAFEGLQILLVEEDEATLKSVMPLLEKWGCETTLAATSDAALSCLQTAGRMPDLLIAGCRETAAETGSQIITALRSKAETSIPAFLLSAESRPQPSELEVLSLPVKPAELRALIAHLLRQSF